MSVWVDIHKRSTGDIDRKEDDIRIMIASVLSSYVVGPNQSPPMRQFIMYIKENYTNIITPFSIVLCAYEHPDKTRDFCSDKNISLIIEKSSDFGTLIKLI